MNNLTPNIAGYIPFASFTNPSNLTLQSLAESAMQVRNAASQPLLTNAVAPISNSNVLRWPNPYPSTPNQLYPSNTNLQLLQSAKPRSYHEFTFLDDLVEIREFINQTPYRNFSVDQVYYKDIRKIKIESAESLAYFNDDRPGSWVLYITYKHTDARQDVYFCNNDAYAKKAYEYLTNRVTNERKKR